MIPLALRKRIEQLRFFQGEKAVAASIVLNHRRIFILPNQRGFGLALLLIIQLLVATNYNNNLAFILTFLLASIALLGILYAYRNLAGLTIQTTGQGNPVFAGDTAVFQIMLDNPSQLPRTGLTVAFKKATPVPINLMAHASGSAKLQITAEKRGWLAMPTVTCASTFPLGLYRAWSPNNLLQRILVYPKPSPRHLPFPEAPGQGARQPNADDFRGFQSYQPGDPLRRIHWKGVAKGQAVQIKQFHGQEHRALTLDWAVTPGDGTEARLSQLCRWLLDAEQAGMTYALSLPGTDIPPASGPAHLRRCLEVLALFGQ